MGQFQFAGARVTLTGEAEVLLKFPSGKARAAAEAAKERRAKLVESLERKIDEIRSQRAARQMEKKAGPASLALGQVMASVPPGLLAAPGGLFPAPWLSGLAFQLPPEKSPEDNEDSTELEEKQLAELGELKDDVESALKIDKIDPKIDPKGNTVLLVLPRSLVPHAGAKRFRQEEAVFWAPLLRLAFEAVPGEPRNVPDPKKLADPNYLKKYGKPSK
jgi:hypothetical protein